MTKADLIQRMAEGAGITKAQAERALSAFETAVTDTVAAGGKVTLVGFGTFAVSERSARTGRNPRTGEEIAIGERRVVKFRPGKELSERVAG